MLCKIFLAGQFGDHDTDHNGEGRCAGGCFSKDPDYGADEEPDGKGAVQVGERDEDDNY